jgi:hypothetical protein
MRKVGEYLITRLPHAVDSIKLAMSCGKKEPATDLWRGVLLYALACEGRG